MSKLGIGLFYFALAGALAALVFGYLLIQKYSSSQSDLSQTKQTLTSTRQEVVKAKQATDAANSAKDQATTELTEEQSKFNDASAKLATDEATQSSLQTQLTQAQADAQKAKADLQHVTDTLGMSPEAMKDAYTKAQGDASTAQSQLKIVQDQYQATEKQVADLQDAINRSHVGKMPPGISGKVTFVNRAWNFVVLNVGLSNGVVPNGELIVYRGRDFLGKVKVTSAEANTAVADILPNAKGDIQTGDDVLN